MKISIDLLSFLPILAFSNEFIKSDTNAQNTKLDAIVVSSTGFENTLKNELKKYTYYNI